MHPFPPDSLPTGRPPQEVAEGLWVFCPQSGEPRHCLLVASYPDRTRIGGRAGHHPGQHGAAVAPRRRSDCSDPSHSPWPLRRLVQHLGWQVWIQEQEAYLLPTMALQTFGQEQELGNDLALYWTPGPTPGSCCLHWRGHRSVLFCGRLLQPQSNGHVAPVPTAHTFHWGRLLTSLARLRQWLGPDEPGRIACSTGLVHLSGAALVDHGASALAELNLETLHAVGRGPNLPW